MSPERMGILEFGKDYMNADLLSNIDKYKMFEINDKPTVTVLCSNNQILLEMQKITDNYQDINFYVCGTFNGNYEVIDKLKYSDFVIVNTTALKIAPEGLYKTLERVKEYRKDTYFILSGWNSLPRSSDFSQKKLAKIEDEYPFVNIKDSRNVFDSKIEGYYPIQETFDCYCKKIVEHFHFIHSIQVESLYNTLKTDVSKFRNNMFLDIQKELSVVLNVYNDFISKKQRFAITFQHITVNVSDVFEFLENSVKSIDVDEAICLIEDNDSSPKQLFLDNSNDIEHQLKIKLWEKINTVQVSDLNTNLLRSKSQLQVNNLIGELLSVLNYLSACRFVKKTSINDIENIIRDTSSLSSCLDQYIDGVSAIFDKVKESLKAKILGFQFDYNYNKKSNLNKIIDDGMSDDEKKSNEKWNCFISEIQRLLEYTKSALSVLVFEKTTGVNLEIEKQFSNNISNYFNPIIVKIETITNTLNIMLKNYDTEIL